MSSSESYLMHPIFQVDPRIRRTQIKKYVEIITKRENAQGFLMCADPVSQSILISMPVPESNKFKNRLIPGSSIVDVLELKPPEELKPPDNPVQDNKEFSSEELLEKRTKICEWLLRNLLPVSVDKDVINVYNGQLLIYPPYEPSNCVTENSIVLSRMTHLLKNVPG